jgi:tRNA(Ile)-lysidine synthetase-like protein
MSQEGEKKEKYASPRQVGGQLIRNVIGLMRSQGITLPISSHILIGVSGGADSVALAHLFVKYGRRIINPQKIRLCHFNHHWRAAESDKDELFVRELANRWAVPLEVIHLEPPSEDWAGKSWEEEARLSRNEEFVRLSKIRSQEQGEEGNTLILTAHHADDLAETLLWRIFTGAAQTHGAGIFYQEEGALRPFLRTRKATLLKFLEEEGVRWREDASNSEGRFMRAQMRQELLPLAESLFPRAIEHLVDLGFRCQNRNSLEPEAFDEREFDPISFLFGSAGVRARRTHWSKADCLMDSIENEKKTKGEMHLQDGWRFSWNKNKDDEVELVLKKALKQQ